jgi:hemerythrin
MIEWKEEYALGIETIDDQHKKLFQIADRIYELIRNDVLIDKYDSIIEIINELKDYTVNHFAAEEEYMKSIGYKRLLSQKAAHHDFLHKMGEIELDKIDNGQNVYLLETLDFVVEWLGQHILKEDKLIIREV